MVAQLTIKKRLLITVSVVLFLCATFVGLIAYVSHRHQLQKGFDDIGQNENNLYHSLLESDASGLARAHAGLDRVEILLRPFAERKREALLSAVTPIFEDLKKNNNITHMYFIDADGRVFLRPHRPDIFGDKVTRGTFRIASTTGKTGHGIDMGQNFFSLRSVRAVSYKGKPIGYMEVAEEIDHLFTQMKEITGNDETIFLSEEYLSTQPTQIHNEKVNSFTILEST